jgi:hypothetical protein
LKLWDQKEQVGKLVNHIKESATRSEGRNTLWEHFGLSTRVEFADGKATSEDKLEYLTFKIDALGRKLEQWELAMPHPIKEAPEMPESRSRAAELRATYSSRSQMAKLIGECASGYGVNVVHSYFKEPDTIELIVGPPSPSPGLTAELRRNAEQLGCRFTLLEIVPSDNVTIAQPKSVRSPGNDTP